MDDDTGVTIDRTLVSRNTTSAGARVRTTVRAFWGGLAYQLEGLSEEEWQRGGLHPELGPVTVHSRAELMAESVRLHLEQVQAAREQLRAEG